MSIEKLPIKQMYECQVFKKILTDYHGFTEERKIEHFIVGRNQWWQKWRLITPFGIGFAPGDVFEWCEIKEGISMKVSDSFHHRIVASKISSLPESISCVAAFAIDNIREN